MIFQTDSNVTSLELIAEVLYDQQQNKTLLRVHFCRRFLENISVG